MRFPEGRRGGAGRMVFVFYEYMLGQAAKEMNSISRKFDLLFNLAGRDFKLKYRESVLGAVWSVLVPLVMLGLYTAVFSTIFNARWGGHPVVDKADYAVILFIGLIVYGIFAETISRAPTIIMNHPGFVKKVVFPLEVLPGVVLLSTLYNAAMECVALIIFLCFSSFGFHAVSLLFPVVLIPFLAMVYGLALIFSSLGVFIRDFDQFAGLLARIMMYLMPVLYPASIFPEPWRSWMKANPMSVFIEQMRNIVVFGKLPTWVDLGWASLWAVGILMLGAFWFQKTRRAFADVI